MDNIALFSFNLAIGFGAALYLNRFRWGLPVGLVLGFAIGAVEAWAGLGL